VEASSPHAGLLATSRAFRSLRLPDLIQAQLSLRERQCGYREAQMSEALVLLQTVGGHCPEVAQLLAHDPCLERGLGEDWGETSKLPVDITGAQYAKPYP
jgi:hypothetical protein